MSKFWRQIWLNDFYSLNQNSNAYLTLYCYYYLFPEKLTAPCVFNLSVCVRVVFASVAVSVCGETLWLCVCGETQNVMFRERERERER